MSVFYRDIDVKISDYKSELSKPLVIFERDRGLEIYFNLVEYAYRFDKNPSYLLKNLVGAYATVTLVNPAGYEIRIDEVEITKDAKVKFVVTDDLTDELTEIGTYQLQIHINNDVEGKDTSVFSIPPFSFEVRERLKGRKSELFDLEGNGLTDKEGYQLVSATSNKIINFSADKINEYLNSIPTIQGKIKDLNSQLEHIAINVNSFNGSDNEKIQKAIDIASSRGGGTVILENSDYTVDSIIVKDNVKLQCRNTTIVASGINKPIVVNGNNVVLDNVRVNCNSMSNLGIYVDSYLNDITIKNCEVYNVNVEDNPAYGIYISSYGSKNIVVDNCNIHDIRSNPNGNVAIRDGGWSKGLVIDKPTYVNGNSSLGSKPNTANITITNNIIENILPGEDGDGIYVEGNDITNVINLKINNNTLKNCGKRGIKILPCSEVIITNNYIENNLPIAFSFISFYADRVTVANNRCIKINNYIENGIEFGYDHVLYEIDEGLSDIIISNNTLICGETGINYGILVTHKQKIDNLSINNNIIKGSNYGVALRVLNVISNINISSNIMDKLRGCAIYNRGCLNGCIIENNIATGELSTSAIDINVDSSITDKVIKNVMIHDNYINKTKFSGLSLMYGDEIRVINNNFYCDGSSVYVDTANVTNYYIQNNINLKDNSYSNYDMFKSDSNMIISSGANEVLTIPKVLSKTVIVKYTVANTISNIVGEMGTILILTTSSGDLTINNSSDIALKGSLNVTLAFQQSITLIRVDNRWIEISRNF